MWILEIIYSYFVKSKNYIALAVAFLSLVGTAFSQTSSVTDSLEKELSEELVDTVRVAVLLELSDAYTFTDFPKSIDYAKQANELATTTNSHFLKYRANQRLGLSYSLEGDFTSALKYETLSLQLAYILVDSSSIGLSHSNIGNYYYEIGEYDEAYYYFTQAYRILQKSSKNSIDSLYMNISLHNVGRVFKELGQFEVALRHLKLSQKISETIDDLEGKPYSFDEIGDVKLRMGDYDSALYYLTRSISEGKKIMASEPLTTLKELQPKTFSKIAKTHLHKGDYAKSFIYYDSTYKIHELTGNKFGIAEVELGRGTALLRQEKYDDAMRSIERSVALAREINARILEITCYKQLSVLWEKKGDFKKSLEYFKQFNVLDDSLFSNEIQQKLLRDQIRFETSSRDDQIAALTRLEENQKSELRKQEFIRNILVVIVALTGILLVSVYRGGQRRKQINMLLLQHQEEMEKRSKELEQLNQVKEKFFSIISHDLRSPINALAGLMDLLDKDAIQPHELPIAIKELRVRFNHTRTLMNNLLDWTVLQMDKLNLQATNVSLHKLAGESIELVSSIQNKNIKIVNNIPENSMAYADSNTISLVIRNLITNALKFTNDHGEITLSAEAKGNEWIISITDNGVGMSAEALAKLFNKISPYSSRGTANEKGAGLGLILCKEFVEKNGGQIWAESEEGKGSTFRFTVPKAS
jgi:signal transduction histidine kinase/Tfp pilus assembly protein PilF